ncbi:zinc finger ccch type domain containing protein [Stylonychia lemnae]|uniref:Zinc finger ccch type domain containing protein n=1 Tax=Stylonychia lemnae TaxID=5949 RepID=A0A077ZVD7_STYLE|nr:zinc finger ccch type domain containing protein [Stylonychia lemnae]|eukprot:CDW73819.1 zinc finger ccch type domain containing protein [Stylonychia lemnae]
MFHVYQEFQLREKPEDQLMMTNFKTSKCEDQQHLQQPQKYANECYSYHGNFDRRRSLFNFQGLLRYSDQICSNILQHQLLTKQCPDECKYSHNHFEENYHVRRYRTEPCDNPDHYMKNSQGEEINNIQSKQILIQTCCKYHEPSQVRLNATKYQETSPRDHSFEQERQASGQTQTNMNENHNLQSSSQGLAATEHKAYEKQDFNSINNLSPYYMNQYPGGFLAKNSQPMDMNTMNSQFSDKQYVQTMGIIQQDYSQNQSQNALYQEQSMQSYKMNMHYYQQQSTIQQQPQFNNQNILTIKPFIPINKQNISQLPLTTSQQQPILNNNYYPSQQPLQYQTRPLQQHNSNYQTDISQPYPQSKYGGHKSAHGQTFEIIHQQGNEIIRHLILSNFKTDPCNIQHQHNHKHCRFYHTIKDKRRKLDYYTPDLCEYSETDKCPNKDTQKYKTKFCTKFPKQLAQCEYGEYCSFAHSQKDIKTRIIHFMQKDSDFYQFYFKTEWCPFNKEHNKAQCDYAHNWQDFRRKPHLFNYDSNDLCPNWKAGTFISKYEEGCILQAACLRSHGWKEQEYHPYHYKTKPCQEVKCGQIHQCPFYHSDMDRRAVTEDQKQQVMTPKARGAMEQLHQINQTNLVINNVNHLKELLANYGLFSLNFQHLIQSFKDYQVPNEILEYIDEKGVVPSERMTLLIYKNELKINPSFAPPPVSKMIQTQSYQQYQVIAAPSFQTQKSILHETPFTQQMTVTTLRSSLWHAHDGTAHTHEKPSKIDHKSNNSFFEEDYEEEEDDEVTSQQFFQGVLKTIEIEYENTDDDKKKVQKNISFGSDIDSIKKLKNKNYERQVTAQPVSYKNKLQQFQQEFLRSNTLKKENGGGSSSKAQSICSQSLNSKNPKVKQHTDEFKVQGSQFSELSNSDNHSVDKQTNPNNERFFNQDLQTTQRAFDFITLDDEIEEDQDQFQFDENNQMNSQFNINFYQQQPPQDISISPPPQDSLGQDEHQSPSASTNDIQDTKITMSCSGTNNHSTQCLFTHYTASTTNSTQFNLYTPTKYELKSMDMICESYKEDPQDQQLMRR